MPEVTVTVAEPSGSEMLSSDVATVSATRPEVGIVTLRAPFATPKSPDADTDTSTVNGDEGAGLANSVNVASSPSITLSAVVMLTLVPSLTGCLGSPETARLKRCVWFFP